MSSIDERIEKLARQPAPFSLPERPRSKPPYKIRQVVRVRITAIKEGLGAFVETVDGKCFQGMIHISGITDAHVHRIEDHLSLYKEVNAIVKNIHPDGKIDFSLIDRENFVEEKNIQEDPPKKIENTPIETATTRNSNEKTDLDHIYIYLQRMVGVLSEPSKKRVKELYREKGAVPLTIAIMEALKDFVPDLSHYLINEIEKKRGMNFKSVEYFASEHAVDQSGRVKQRTQRELERLTAKEGRVLLETSTHRYVQVRNFRLPCKKDGEVYIIKSLISPGMFMRAYD